MSYGWLFDPKLCIECRGCEAACKQWNGVQTLINVRWRQVYERETAGYPSPALQVLSLSCNHCEKAWCAMACPVKAIKRRPDGIVYIDHDVCVGCRFCAKFCPYPPRPQFNAVKHKMEKCHMCYDRIDQGLQPACAANCPTGALKWGKWEDISSQGEGMVEGFTDPKYTRPHIRFITQGW
jgi:Fe-S-cluster-containing dehydrogenase component